MKSLKDKLSRFLLPLLLGVAIMSSIIYDYRSSSAASLTALSAAEGLVSFALLDFLYHRKHKFLSGCVYLLMFCAAVYASFNMVYAGYTTSRIDFNSWFYLATDYVPMYLYALVFGGGFLFYSALYYFTQVRYRGLFTLFLVLFPFAIYAKRLDVMPNGYLAAILLSYLLVMVHNRQTAADSKIAVVPDRSYAVSIAVFGAAVVGILFLMPKPEIESVQEKDSEAFNNLGFFGNEVQVPTDIDLSDTAEREHDLYPTGRELFVVAANEDTVYLKTQSYSYFEDNKWHFGKEKYDDADYVWSEPQETISGMSVLNKLEILKAYCEQSGDKERLEIIGNFKKEYSLQSLSVFTVSDLMFRFLSLPELTLSVKSNWNYIDLPDPQRANNYCNGEWEIRRASIGAYEASYESNLAARQLSEKLGMTTEEWNSVMRWYREGIDEKGFSGQLYQYANNDRSIAAELDSGEFDEYDDRIRQLAQQITQGCTTDYEKAAALEKYFTQAGFVYDLSYSPDDDSIEYFLFESKTGICSDFATAMTLMARSVGLTARYCEGYIAFEKISAPSGSQNMQSSYKNRLLVRDSNGHAFVEVYLPAVGWVVFEPTVAGFEQLMNIIPESGGIGALGGGRTLYMALGIAAAAALLILIFRRPVAECAFRVYISHVDGEKAVRKLYKRLVKRVSRKLDTDLSAYTAEQVCALLCEYGVDISALTAAFEKAFYGKIPPEENERAEAYEQYKTFGKAKLKKAAIDSGQ